MIALIVFWMFLVPAKTVHGNIEVKFYQPIYIDTFKNCENTRKRYTSLPKCFKVVE